MKTKMYSKILAGILIVVVLLVGIVMAHEHNFAETKQLIDSGISCEKLIDEQLEAMGDYYMEQMHPGEAHEMMDQMMGGEGSESLKQMHIQMAKWLYCNEDVGGMMGGGMMNIMGTNMMGGSFGGGSWWLWSIMGMLFWIALLIALILLIIWLYKKVTGQTTNGSSALDILKKRFTKGEITKKEFESMKKEIKR